MPVSNIDSIFMIRFSGFVSKEMHYERKNRLFELTKLIYIMAGMQSICDMIKRNESAVGHIVFEILAKTVFKFLCFMFLALTNSS